MLHALKIIEITSKIPAAFFICVGDYLCIYTAAAKEKSRLLLRYLTFAGRAAGKAAELHVTTDDL